MTVSNDGNVYLAGTTASNAGIATPAGYDATPNAYPNPASTSLRVSVRYAAEGPLRLEAYSPAGQRVYAGPVNGNTPTAIDVRKWQKGVYVRKARTPSGSTTTKIIVQ